MPEDQKYNINNLVKSLLPAILSAIVVGLIWHGSISSDVTQLKNKNKEQTCLINKNNEKIINLMVDIEVGKQKTEHLEEQLKAIQIKLDKIIEKLEKK